MKSLGSKGSRLRCCFWSWLLAQRAAEPGELLGGLLEERDRADDEVEDDAQRPGQRPGAPINPHWDE